MQNVVEAIAGDFPVFVVKGSGRVADLICAIREHESMTYVKNQCESIVLFSTEHCFVQILHLSHPFA